MPRRPRRVCASAATFALVVTVALGIAPAALADDPASPAQPSAIERLIRQEDSRPAELARYGAMSKQNALTAMLDARERARVAITGHGSELDPAIRTAIAAHAAERPTTPSPAAVPSVGTDEFAWGAAALGLGVGVAAMCVLLGCVTLVRSHGRLRSV